MYGIETETERNEDLEDFKKKVRVLESLMVTIHPDR
jgi:hypothetical protein